MEQKIVTIEHQLNLSIQQVEEISRTLLANFYEVLDRTPESPQLDSIKEDYKAAVRLLESLENSKRETFRFHAQIL